MKPITYKAKFKIRSAEGKTSKTGRYVGEELDVEELAFIIEYRQHEIVLDWLKEDGVIGGYDKHYLQINYDGEGWEELGRLDLGNNASYTQAIRQITQALEEGLNGSVAVYWSNMVEHGKDKLQQRGIID